MYNSSFRKDNSLLYSQIEFNLEFLAGSSFTIVGATSFLGYRLLEFLCEYNITLELGMKIIVPFRESSNRLNLIQPLIINKLIIPYPLKSITDGAEVKVKLPI